MLAYILVSNLTYSEQIYCIKNVCKLVEILCNFCVQHLCYTRQHMDKVKQHHFCYTRHITERSQNLVGNIRVNVECNNARAENGFKPILYINICIIINTMLKLMLTQNADVKCKQTFRSESREFITEGDKAHKCRDHSCGSRISQSRGRQPPKWRLQTIFW